MPAQSSIFGGAPGSFLDNVAAGFFASDYLRDYTLASKMFRSNAYSYAPKFKFLFHTYFEINPQLAPYLSLPNDSNFGLAVKTIDLPKYSFDLQEMNQYNRKRIVQTKIKYDPVRIAFHDDNANLIRQLWYLYYTYYYKDATQIENNPASTQMLPKDISVAALAGNGKLFDYGIRNIYSDNVNATGNGNWGFTPGGVQVPFFKSIQIFGFNQHNFAMYKLVNPIIESFGHDSYNYSEGGGTMENTMTVRYETVKYYTGAINGRVPDATVPLFGTVDHYDRVLSPIARPGSQANILGPGGLVEAGLGVINDLQDGTNPLAWLNLAQIAGQTYGTLKYNNFGQMLKADLLNNLNWAIPSAVNTAFNGYAFPRAGQTGTPGTTSTGPTEAPTVGGVQTAGSQVNSGYFPPDP